MMISGKIRTAMIDHAMQEAPIEACGYLAGVSGSSGSHARRQFALKNIDAREDHFSFDPQEQFTVCKAVRQEGLQIVAVYHSHPVTPARPSEEDIRLAYDPEIVYVIVSLDGGEPSIRGFRILKGVVEEEPIIIEDNP